MRHAAKVVGRAVVVAALFGVTSGGANAASVGYGGDDARSGWYPDQAGLTPALVSGTTFRRLFSVAVKGQVYAQPLVGNGVLLVATEANWAYGLDPATGVVKWSRQVGTPWNASDLSCPDLTPTIGITGTPVIDTATSTAYFVAKRYLGGTSGSAVFDMHAVNVTTGAERTGFPVRIAGTAQNDPLLAFNGNSQMQRPGLLLQGGVVYAAFGSFCDYGQWQGWVFGVSTSGAIKARWVARGGTGNGNGIWMSGGGLVSDGPGRILFTTGNGASPTAATPGTTPPANLGDSVVRLAVQADGTLEAVDFFAPQNAPTADTNDMDLGSGAPNALPAAFGNAKVPRVLVQPSKDGYLYVLNRDALGGFRQGTNGGDKVVARIGPHGGYWSHPAAWPGDGGWLYLPSGSNGSTNYGTSGFLRVFRHTVDSAGNPTFYFAATTPDVFGYGSSAPVVTSNGTTSGSALVWIVWAQNASGSNAQLRAYDPVPKSGNPVLRWSAPVGTASKFVPPGIAGNRVYVGTRDGHVLAFGAS